MNQQHRAVVQHMVEALEQATPHLPVHTDWHFEAIEAGKRLLEQPEPEPKPVAWHDKIMGMEVSMDVSTGDDDIDHRVYGTVYEVIFQDDGGTPDVILAIETERNFTTPPAQDRRRVVNG
jgi:hypothetical protein